ncbi:hypothetical protein BDZ97DRAFT_636061 [Flammula alnicola]|nr:hypothetical protein BDZ97DRAFT_636061 [Flammula alnicola]
MDKGKKRDTNLSENTIPPVSHTLSVGRSAYSQHMSDANSRYLSSPPTPNSARSSRSLDDINSLASLARNPSTQSPSTRRSHPRRRMVSGIPVRKGSSLHRHSGGRPPTINRVTSGVPQSSSRIANQHLYSADRGPSMNQNYPRSPTVTRYITGTSSAVPSIPIQKSSNIYYRHLSAKARGSPLWIPEPNNYLNVLYRRRGIAIGDVGIITDDGAFDFLFNICLPKNDPMNSGGVPDYYSPLHPPLLPARDIRGHQELGENTYLASEAIKKEISDVGPSGITFIASACEGAILTIPQGAYTENLANTARFNEYLERNVLNWYRYANGICGRQIENGDLRLVIGADKSRAWGMATFANFTEQANVPLKLRFKPSNDSRVGRIYTWDYSGVADSARSGPGRREIEALWTGDEGEEMKTNGRSWNPNLGRHQSAPIQDQILKTALIPMPLLVLFRKPHPAPQMKLPPSITNPPCLVMDTSHSPSLPKTSLIYLMFLRP